jgi:heme exporter protein D
MTNLADFLHMGGYAFYVFASYGCVLAFLFFQWLMPWRRWKKFINE